MKAIIISLVTLVILLSSVTNVSASGGKVRGEDGKGENACVRVNFTGFPR